MAEEHMEHDLDSFLEMDWEGELSPLVRFLNLGHDSDELEEACRSSAKLREQEVPIEDFMDFHKDITEALESLCAIQSSEGSRKVGEFLSSKLAETTFNRIEILDLRARQVRVALVGKNIIAELWADFICIFLSQDDWMDHLGRCPFCKTWLQKSRKDRVYCSEACRGRAAYNRHKKQRRESRRARYRRDKRIIG